MRFIDIINLSLSILGVYGLIFSFRFLIPRHAIPCAATALSEARHLLDHAETVGAIPHGNECRAALAIFETQLLRMRTESHRSPTILQQILLALQSGLTCRLYALSSRIDAIKITVELAIDERQLASLIGAQGVTTGTAPRPVRI